MKVKLTFFFVTFGIITILQGCNYSSSRKKSDRKETSEVPTPVASPLVNKSASNPVKANIYVENSGSMFGYVSTESEFVDALSKLSADCALKTEDVKYFLMNNEVIKLGENTSKFHQILNLKGFKQGDYDDSNLIEMLDKILTETDDESVSILVSDGIYSVESTSPLRDLKSGSLMARNKFIRRLDKKNISTYIIKYSSIFKGEYYDFENNPHYLHQRRPYYMWIIGKPENIKRLFPAEYFQNLPGYRNISKYVVLDNSEITYEYVPHNKKGKLKYRRDNLIFYDVEPDRNKETSFSLAFDFSDIPLSFEYFEDTSVYSNNLGYKVLSIEKVDALNDAVKKFLTTNPTHVVTFSKHGSPWGRMELKIINKKPDWIDRTHSEDDTEDIVGNAESTFGFRYLVDGISEAYKIRNDTEYLYETTININQ